MYVLIIIVIIIIVCLVLFTCSLKNEESKKKLEFETEWRFNQDKIRIDNEQKVKELISEYGELTNVISLGGLNTITNDVNSSIFIFEDSSMIVINNKPYRFIDIVNFELNDNENVIYQGNISTTTTSTGNMLGRAVVGGLLFGGVGAVIGGATANKHTINQPQTSKITHNYSVNIIVNNLSSPTIIVRLGNNESKAKEIVSILSIILQRNKNIQ